MENKLSLTEGYIVEAFHKLLTQKKYEKISVCDICNKAGISRMSFYRSFNSKDDLMFNCIDIIIKKLEKNVSKLENINQYTFLKEYFETFLIYKDVMPSFDDSNIMKNFIIQLIPRIRENMYDDLMSKTSKYIPTFYFSAIIMTTFEWLKDGATESTDEMARLISSLINKNIFDVNHSKKII